MSTKALPSHRCAILAAAGLSALALACVPGGIGSGDGRDTQCDDGTDPVCMMMPPDCDPGEILAHQANCFVCVVPATCAPWGEPQCAGDVNCDHDEYCDPCASSSCPLCNDCIPACRPHGCPSETAGPQCYMERPECGDAGVAVVTDGCWSCVDLDRCEPLTASGDCDDGSVDICDMIPPTCSPDEVLAVQNGCFLCVNPATCIPWGQAGCFADYDCGPEDTCDPCASGSCPGCEDCVPGCLPHGCPTEPAALCNMIRPDCDPGEVSVVVDLCWECVDAQTCQ